jgi:hypothetical protein
MKLPECRSIEYISKHVTMHAVIKDVKLFSAKHRDQNIEILLENPQKILQSVKVSIPMC